jgi:rhamnogalacturonyl hydrolase YesR
MLKPVLQQASLPVFSWRQDWYRTVLSLRQAPIETLLQGYLTGDHYLTVANTALQGVIAQIRPDGEVENVSFGTAMGSDLDFYRNIRITPMPYGQALAMLALVEWERQQRSV